MDLIEDINKIAHPYKNAVITIGNFDGVHIGHQALFYEVIEKADMMGGTSIAMTFEPHPIRALKKNGHPPLITLYEQKVELIKSTGIDVLIGIPFTLEFASISAKDFLAKILLQRIGMKHIVVGKDYTFGKNRGGNLDFLNRNAKKYNYDVSIADWINISDTSTERISSTRIRTLVESGEVKKAQKMLGRYYQIRGTVAKGRDRGGKLLGFPTANINLKDELCPKTGVYAVTVEWGKNRYKGVANIGFSPTFDDEVFTVEVHIFNFNKNIYEQELRVNFIERIRDEQKFSGISELSNQIRKDILKANKILV